MHADHITAAARERATTLLAAVSWGEATTYEQLLDTLTNGIAEILAEQELVTDAVTTVEQRRADLSADVMAIAMMLSTNVHRCIVKVDELVAVTDAYVLTKIPVENGRIEMSISPRTA